MHHSRSKIVHWPRTYSLDDLRYQYCTKRKILLLFPLFVQKAQCKLSVHTLNSFFLVTSNEVVQVPRHKPNLIITTMILLHDVHYIACMKATDPEFYNLSLLSIT